MTEELEVISFAFEGRDMNKELDEANQRIAELEAEAKVFKPAVECCAELRELLTLIRDDLRMRSEDGVVDISDFIWMRIDKALQEKGE